MGKILPITPEEAGIKKVEMLPDFVIQAFNETIIKNLSNNSSRFTVKEVSEHMRSLHAAGDYRLLMTNESFDQRANKEHWYDVENIFDGFGWKVTYESPDRDSSSFDPYFVFSKKR